MGNVWKLESVHEVNIGSIGIVLLGISAYISHQLEERRVLWFPPSVVQLTLGVILAAIEGYALGFKIRSFAISTGVFFYLLLPSIILHSAYASNRKALFANIKDIVFFAVFGTLISTGVVASMLYALRGFFNTGLNNAGLVLNFINFAGILSCVDPVATLAILGHPEVNVNADVYSLIFGESIVSDAVALVMFRSLSAFLLADTELGTVDFIAAMGYFLASGFLSTLIGVLCGALCSLLCKKSVLREQTHPELEILAVISFAYASYLFCEMFALSGTNSIFFCGLVLSVYNEPNLSSRAKVGVQSVIGMACHVAESITYIYIGYLLLFASFNDFEGFDFKWNFGLIAWALFACFVGRMSNVLLISCLLNRSRRDPISPRMQCMMVFAGTRGALAFVLSENYPDLQLRPYVTTTVLFFVVSSTLLAGLGTEYIVNILDLKNVSNNPHNPLAPNRLGLLTAGEDIITGATPNSNVHLGTDATERGLQSPMHMRASSLHHSVASDWVDWAFISKAKAQAAVSSESRFERFVARLHVEKLLPLLTVGERTSPRPKTSTRRFVASEPAVGHSVSWRLKRAPEDFVMSRTVLLIFVALLLLVVITRSQGAPPRKGAIYHSPYKMITTYLQCCN
jgi:sodium/hydrogen exchanger 8